MREVLYCEFWFKLRLTIYGNIGYKLSQLFITVVAGGVIGQRLEFRSRGINRGSKQILGINRGLKGGGTLEFK